MLRSRITTEDGQHQSSTFLHPLFESLQLVDPVFEIELPILTNSFHRLHRRSIINPYSLQNAINLN
jgi:hypothetical protein